MAHWTFDQTLDDSGPNGNHGVFYGNLEIDPTYVLGYDDTDNGAIQFDGLDDYVRITYASGLPIYSQPAFTIALWVQGISGQQDRRVYAESSSTSGTPLFSIGTDGTTADGLFGYADIYVRGNTNPVNHRQSTQDAFDGTWHHIAYVDNNGTASLYIDGLLQTTNFNYTRPTLVADTTVIGAVIRDTHTTPQCCFFNGAVDDVYVFDKALTLQEIWDLLPDPPCPETGDTHCKGFSVATPAGNAPGLCSITANPALDDSGDQIYYTFSADNGAGTVLTVGPQLEVAFADMTLTEGTWTITVTVDDDPGCPDQADDAVCTQTVALTCPAAGDTFVASLTLTGPADNTPGLYRATAVGATDDSGDAISYTFVADNGQGVRVTFGPRTALNSATPEAIDLGLTEGAWTISVTVDDNPLCGDTDPRAAASTQVTVVPLAPGLIAHWPLDGDLGDAVNENDGTFFGGEAVYVDGRDGTIGGALSFDGIDDYVDVLQAKGLPISVHKAISIALWVKGLPQADRRVFSEGTHLPAERNPLYTLGTSTADSGAADLFVRGDAGANPVNHARSTRAAFDDTWHHLVLVDNAGDATFYIDGVRDATHVTYLRPLLTATATAFGAVLRDVAAYWFTGALDDIRIYNYALSEAEILALVPEPAGCPAAGDTHAAGVQVSGPDGNMPGPYTITETGATDEGGDAIYYTFVAQNQDGYWMQSGPDVFASAQFFLTPGTWTITVTVDDDLACRDRADNATATTTVTVKMEDPVLISHLPFDNSIADVGDGGNTATFLGLDTPVFVEDHLGNANGAMAFDGLDDLVQISHDALLPLYTHYHFSVAMWVKGMAGQPDRRVFSEASTTTNNTLFNFGTDNTGATGEFDAYIRNDANAAVLAHTHSLGTLYDNEWHHFAWVDRYGQVTLYIDGVPDAALFNYTRGGLTCDTTTVGGILRAAPSYWFSGAIDDVRLYNSALTPEQIDELINGVVEPKELFRRGDPNEDGQRNIADAIALLGHLFAQKPAPGCMDGADANDDGNVNIADAIRILGHLFANTGPLPDPFATCGEDSTADKLAPCVYPRCQ